MVKIMESLRSVFFGPVYHKDRAVSINVSHHSITEITQKLEEIMSAAQVKVIDFSNNPYTALFGKPSLETEPLGEILRYLLDTADEMDAPLTSLQITPVTCFGQSGYSIAGYCYHRNGGDHGYSIAGEYYAQVGETRDENVLELKVIPI